MLYLAASEISVVLSIAATILYIASELLRRCSNYRMLIYAVVLIVVMLFSWSPKATGSGERYSLKRLSKKIRQRGGVNHGNAGSKKFRYFFWRSESGR